MNNETKKRTLFRLVAAVIAAIIGVVVSKQSAFVKRNKSPFALSLHDWKQALLETKTALGNKNLPIIAGGVAFFLTLAFFPLVAAAVAIAGYVISPEQIQTISGTITTYFPADMAKLITTQLQNVTANKSSSVIVAAVAIGISLYGASGAVRNLITATNVAYSRKESRGIIKRYLVSLGLTVAAIIGGFIVISLIIINADTLAFLGLPGILITFLLAVRWLLIVALVTMGLAIFYYIGPDRDNPPWQWVSWGAILATIVWLLGTILFFIYVQNFANYSNSYSLYAGIIVLMTWLNLSAFIVLLGAQINHRLELKR